MSKKGRPELVKATTTFNRKTLRKVTLALYDNDVFQITTKILNRDTLKVQVIISHFTMPTLWAVATMHREAFSNIGSKSIEDWCPKSSTEGSKPTMYTYYKEW